MLRHSRPQTALDAKFSAEFGAASAVVAGQVGLAQLRDEFVRSGAVQALFPRVKVTAVDDPSDNRYSRAATRFASRSRTARYSRAARCATPWGMRATRSGWTSCAKNSTTAWGVALAPRRREALFAQLLELETLAEPAALYRQAA
jgi:2-methylcitrate dehydratase PrpD